MIEAIHSKLKNQVNIGNFEMRAPHINKSDNEIIGNYRREHNKSGIQANKFPGGGISNFR